MWMWKGAYRIQEDNYEIAKIDHSNKFKSAYVSYILLWRMMKYYSRIFFKFWSKYFLKNGKQVSINCCMG